MTRPEEDDPASGSTQCRLSNSKVYLFEARTQCADHPLTWVKAVGKKVDPEIGLGMQDVKMRYIPAFPIYRPLCRTAPQNKN